MKLSSILTKNVVVYLLLILFAILIMSQLLKFTPIMFKEGMENPDNKQNTNSNVKQKNTVQTFNNF